MKKITKLIILAVLLGETLVVCLLGIEEGGPDILIGVWVLSSAWHLMYQTTSMPRPHSHAFMAMAVEMAATVMLVGEYHELAAPALIAVMAAWVEGF